MSYITHQHQSLLPVNIVGWCLTLFEVISPSGFATHTILTEMFCRKKVTGDGLDCASGEPIKKLSQLTSLSLCLLVSLSNSGLLAKFTLFTVRMTLNSCFNFRNFFISIIRFAI